MTFFNQSPKDIYTVSRLNREVNNTIKDSFPSIWVQGEISNLAKPPSGHLYFTLKDDNAQIRCAMFKNRRLDSRFKLEDGMSVMIQANIGIYQERGEYQLIVETLKPLGLGSLQLAFETLKQKLSKEGLFNESNKKSIPYFAKTIGIITSPTGAAICDVLSVLKRRYPCSNIIIYPIPVQGEGAAKKIADTIFIADKRKDCDVLILTRGGGSLEDLWSFNEEIVARAIYACKIPMVCGVGHEVDFTIADFVADKRASTPSTAAELVSPDKNKLLTQIQRYLKQFTLLQENKLLLLQQKIISLSKQITHPKHNLQKYYQQMDGYSLILIRQMETILINKKNLLNGCKDKITKQNLHGKIKQQLQTSKTLESFLKKAMQQTLKNQKHKISHLKEILLKTSHPYTLSRGYAIVTDSSSGSIIRESCQTKKGHKINICLNKIEIKSTVDDVYEK